MYLTKRLFFCARVEHVHTPCILSQVLFHYVRRFAVTEHIAETEMYGPVGVVVVVVGGGGGGGEQGRTRLRFVPSCGVWVSGVG